MRALHFIGIATVAVVTTACGGGHRSEHPDYIDTTYIHRYGVEVSGDDWEARGQDGQMIAKRKDGVIVTQTYTSGQLDGETTYTFPHSETIEKLEIYSRDTLEEEVTYYYSGLPRQATLYRPDGTKTVNIWYETGSPQSMEDYEGGRLITAQYYSPMNQAESRIDHGDGVCIRRDAYGQLVCHDVYQKGEIVRTKTFHGNGSPKEIIPYEEGVISGTRRTFLPTGEPETIELWSDGKRNGAATQFHNGEKYAELSYKDGKKDGVERRFRDGKNIGEEISWREDEKDGPTRVYLGDTVSTEWYFEGKKVSKNQYDQLTRRRS